MERRRPGWPCSALIFSRPDCCARSAIAVAIHASHVLYNRFIVGSGSAALAGGNFTSTAAEGRRADGSAVPSSNADNDWPQMACSEVQASNDFGGRGTITQREGNGLEYAYLQAQVCYQGVLGLLQVCTLVLPRSRCWAARGRTKPSIPRISFISSWDYHMYGTVSQPMSTTSSV